MWKSDLLEMRAEWKSWRFLSKLIITVNILGVLGFAWFIVYWISAMASCVGDCAGVQAEGMGMFLFLVPGAAFNLVFGVIWLATERKDP